MWNGESFESPMVQCAMWIMSCLDLDLNVAI